MNTCKKHKFATSVGNQCMECLDEKLDKVMTLAAQISCCVQHGSSTKHWSDEITDIAHDIRNNILGIEDDETAS